MSVRDTATGGETRCECGWWTWLLCPYCHAEGEHADGCLAAPYQGLGSGETGAHPAGQSSQAAYSAPVSTDSPQNSLLDRDGWPKRWSDPHYLGDGPWGA